MGFCSHSLAKKRAECSSQSFLRWRGLDSTLGKRPLALPNYPRNPQRVRWRVKLQLSPKAIGKCRTRSRSPFAWSTSCLGAAPFGLILSRGRASKIGNRNWRLRNGWSVSRLRPRFCLPSHVQSDNAHLVASASILVPAPGPDQLGSFTSDFNRRYVPAYEEPRTINGHP